MNWRQERERMEKLAESLAESPAAASALPARSRPDPSEYVDFWEQAYGPGSSAALDQRLNAAAEVGRQYQQLQHQTNEAYDHLQHKVQEERAVQEENAKKGVLAGSLAGIAGGALLGGGVAKLLHKPAASPAAVGGLLGLFPGIIGGAAVGSAMQTDRRKALQGDRALAGRAYQAADDRQWDFEEAHNIARDDY